jgi:hypothetical protein
VPRAEHVPHHLQAVLCMPGKQRLFSFEVNRGLCFSVISEAFFLEKSLCTLLPSFPEVVLELSSQILTSGPGSAPSALRSSSTAILSILTARALSPVDQDSILGNWASKTREQPTEGRRLASPRASLDLSRGPRSQGHLHRAGRVWHAVAYVAAHETAVRCLLCFDPGWQSA